MDLRRWFVIAAFVACTGLMGPTVVNADDGLYAADADAGIWHWLKRLLGGGGHHGGGHHSVPELNASGAGSALLLLGGGLAVVLERRRRR